MSNIKVSSGFYIFIILIISFLFFTYLISKAQIIPKDNYERDPNTGLIVQPTSLEKYGIDVTPTDKLILQKLDDIEIQIKNIHDRL